MKKTNTRLTALALALALLLTSCGGGASAATMHLRKTEGMVGVSDNEGKDIAPKDNLGLYSGYGVKTQTESYAWIDLDRVKLTKMDADSEIEIAKEGKKLEINVKSGSLFFNVTEPLEDDETMDIVTSTMMVGIRGTCGWVTDNTAALLEGAVSVTAGDQEVTITAGEMAVLTEEGVLEVKPFTAATVPAFVREEIADDEDLAANIQDTTGMDLTGANPMAAYEELLSTMEDVVYSEVIDFEGDGSPELLILTMNFYDFNDPPDAYTFGSDNILYFRNAAEGSKPWEISWSPIYRSGTFSLVESNGRLFVRRQTNDAETHRIFVDYCGSVAQNDGGRDEWGRVDSLVYRVDSSTNQRRGGYICHHDENGLVIEWEGDAYDGSIAALEAVESKYTHVRNLLTYEGRNVTVVEP